MRHQNDQSGFTLIEISIVLLIVGIIISAISTVLPSIISTSKIKRTNATLEKLDYSLQGYMIANSRLPCPDTDGDGRENLSAGAGSDCSSYIGDIPFIDLGVSSGNDPFSNPVGYAVYGAAGATEIDLTNTFADANDFLINGLNAATSEMAATGFVSNKVYTTFSDINNTVDNSTRAGQAYVLVSGGQRDINAPVGFYDHLNFTGNTQFAAPNKINTDNYDDSVLAQGPNFLAGKHFSGSGSGGSGVSNNFENTNTLCQDGSDNDSDGATDCADSDCTNTAHCTAQTNVTVASTPALPVGSVGASPSYTFSASGGSSTPLYYWTINSISPELSGDLGVNYFTGVITGSYDACPGTYLLTVRADDRNDGSNFDTEDFSITINNGSLGILPLPSGGVDYTVDSTLFSQTFTLTGGTAGTTQWSINWQGGDPTGLTLQTASDSNSAELVKTAGSNSGSYAFTITISDSDCPANTFTSPTYTLEVTGSGSAPPIDSGLVAEWRFDEAAWTIAPGEIKDSSENDNHGTVNGDVFPSTANPAMKTIPGTCSYAEFDGSRDYIRVPNDPSINFSGEITIAAWVRMDRTTGSQMIAWHGTAPAPNRAVFMRVINGRLYVGKRDPNRFARYTIPASDIGQWVHYTGLYNGTAWQIYKNGTLVAFTTTTEGALTIDRDWFIGGYFNNHSLLGGIDQLRIYNRALDPTEIVEVMNLTNDCSAQDSVLPSCGLSPSNGIVHTTYDQTGASHPTNAAEFDSNVSTYAIPSNLFGSGIRSQINGSGNPYGSNDRYLSLFQGYIEVPTGGYYTFAVDGDDAIDISIGGNILTGWYGGHGRNGRANFPVSVALQAGFHEILYRHEEISGGDNYYLYWQDPDDTALQITPSSAFKYCP